MPAPPGVVPTELLIGACAEVWADDGADLLAGRRRYGVARLAWEAESGITRETSYRLLPAARPWRLSDPDGPARAARHGVTAAQVSTLRAAAVARVASDHRTDNRRTP